MPIKWQAPPPAKFDKNPTPIDRIIRSGWVMTVAFTIAGVTPIVLIAIIWMLFGDWLKPWLGSQFWFSILVMAITLAVILTVCAACILAERKIAAFIQDRVGPDRVGWGGLVQAIADGGKLFLKEDVTPANVDKPIFLIAPGIAFTVALIGFAVIPWAGQITWPWTTEAGDPVTVTTQVASLDVGILYMLAVGSVAVYGVVLGAWASNNKYATYGGLRAAAQMISYEVPLGLGVLVILLTCGSLRLEEIQDQQIATGMWNVLLHPIMFVVLLVTTLAEANRAPFDLAECEQELVGGFHTEYSSMKLAMFLLGEYAHIVTGAALLTCVFLGGWELPFPLPGFHDSHGWLPALFKYGVFWGKICTIVALFMVIRWTLPRFRFDQLMQMCWKWLVPLGIVMVVASAVLAALGFQVDTKAGFAGNLNVLIAHWVANGVVLAVFLVAAGRSKTPVTGRQDNLPEIQVRPSST